MYAQFNSASSTAPGSVLYAKLPYDIVPGDFDYNMPDKWAARVRLLLGEFCAPKPDKSANPSKPEQKPS